MMEMSAFKKLVDDTVRARGFVRKGGVYLRDGADCSCLLDLQRSGYSAGYYINIGFFLKGLNEPGLKPQVRHADLSSRISWMKDGKKTDLFDLDVLTEADADPVRRAIEEGVRNLVEPALEPGGVRRLLADHPKLLYAMRADAKAFLGIPIT